MSATRLQVVNSREKRLWGRAETGGTETEGGS